MAKQLDFGELDKLMSKVDDLGSIMTENKFAKIDEYIPTGNYLLNAQITGSLKKGVPNNRSIMFSGVSGVGKSFLTMNLCREAQHLGYHIIYGDSEAAIDEEMMTKFGVDPARVRYQPLKTVLHVRHFVSNLCKTLKEKQKAGMEIPKIMFVIDSLGNLATEKEVTDAISGSDKRDMTKQQNLRSMFRVIGTDLAELKIPLVMTNHTYAAIGSYIPMEIQSGGGGSIYNASVILNLGKAQLKDGDSEAQSQGVQKTGIIVTSKPAKNRFARPHPIKFHISFYKGMNPYVGLENFVSWDLCGIGRGKLVEEIHEELIWEDEEKTIPKMYRGSQKKVRTKTGNMTFEADPKANTFAVKHLGRTVKGSEVFSSRVFTEEVLDLLDEKIIRPMFELPKVVSTEDELDEAFDLEDDEMTEEAANRLGNLQMEDSDEEVAEEQSHED